MRKKKTVFKLFFVWDFEKEERFDTIKERQQRLVSRWMAIRKSVLQNQQEK